MFFLHKPAEYAIQICPSRYTNDAVSLVVWQVVVGCSHQLNACADINALADGAQNHCTAFLAVPRRCPASGSNSRRALHRQPTPIYCWPAAVDMRWVREWRCFRGSECRGRLWRGSASTDTTTEAAAAALGGKTSFSTRHSISLTQLAPQQPQPAISSAPSTLMTKLHLLDYRKLLKHNSSHFSIRQQLRIKIIQHKSNCSTSSSLKKTDA